MEFQEKSFEDLLKEDRLKRLGRQLKLQKIRGAANQQSPASPHMSVSGLSSIYGDQGALSDFSFCAPSSSRVSSRAGSVVVASSINLRTELLKNLKQREKTTCRVTSSEIDPRSDVDRSVKDREIMPPPLPPKKCLSQNEKILDKTDDEVSNETSKNVNSNSKQRSSRIFKNWTVKLNDKGQIVIKGRLESGELARSKAVKKRLNANIVISVLNHHYHLVGDINDLKEELPEYVRGKFYNGFPTDWENVRQIWQCYIASGSSSRFRWPRPIADSDDDLRSDITEVTVSRSKRSSVSKTPVPASHSSERSGKNVTKKADSLRERSAMNSDLSSIHLANNEDFSSGVKTSTNVTSVPNEMKRTIEEAGNRSVNREIEAPNGLTACMNCGKLVPRWKIDVIVDNLLNKNCSKEYIDKVITAMDCLNELFSFSPTTTTTTTTMTNDNPETTPDEGVSMNSNSNMQYDSTRDRVKSKSSIEIVSTESQKLQSIISNSNSYSLESSDESENESAIIRNKQNDSTRRCSVQLSQLPCKNPVVAVKQSSERFVDGISKHGENRKFNVELSTEVEGGTAKKYGNRIDRNRRGGKVFNTSLSGVEAIQSSEASPVATNGLPLADINSRQILEPQTRSTLSNKTFRAEAESCEHGDSDISIIDGQLASTTKSKIHTSEKKKSVFVNDKDAGDSRTGSFYSDKTPNLHTKEKILDSSLPAPTNRSSKGIGAQNDCRTPSKLEKATPTRRKAAETSRRHNNSAESDSENVSMRMSSRGRRILPPLDYWNGERAVLRDQELIYTPGTPITNSVSLEISQQSIKPVTSNSTPITTSVNNIKQIKKDSVNQLKSGTNRRTRNRRNGQILREITENRENISDHGMTSGNKSISGRQIGRPRKIEKYVTSSSEEDYTPTANSKRKQRRLY